VEISILGSTQQTLFDHLRGWDLRLAAPGQTLEIWDGCPVELPYHQVWARRGPGRPSSPDAFAADPTMIDFLLEQERDDRWVYRRRPEVTVALDEFGTISPAGVPFVRPQVALLYKASSRATRTNETSTPCFRTWEVPSGRGWRPRWTRRTRATSGQPGSRCWQAHRSTG
jgi:hypothetical protein